MQKTIKDLNLGYSDAQNYMQRENKQILSDVFVKNIYLEKLLNSNIYYLIGEKGTGKTAYATFLSNMEREDSKSVLKYITGTDYEKFYELKKCSLIDISGYADIWRTIILLLFAKTVTDNKKLAGPFNKNNLEKLMQAIDEYYNRAFSPEIVNAMKIVDKSELAAKLISKYIEAGGSIETVNEFDEKRLQMNLFYICKQFSDCLGKFKLTKNVTLFIDGIDVRPNHISYEEYLQCIKGLATATWTLNTELFANTRDSKGHFKVVLLLRPDIFNSLNLQNATNKLADNSVYLDWRTTYKDYYSSNLYKMANKLLSFGQNTDSKDSIWELYFDWELQSSNPSLRKNDTAFMEFLKISLSRPRDIQTILKIIQTIMIDRGLGDDTIFSLNVYKSDKFQNDYSEYFLSSLKDQLSFYYSEDDFKHFRKFFDFFSDAQFSYDDYLTVYKNFEDYILNNARDIPAFMEDPKVFLQLLYDSNVIAAIETSLSSDDKKYFHFSYREKSLSNIAPEVSIGDNITYCFHYGLHKKTKMGRYD